MKPDQEYTPKYWVVHDNSTEDVFIETANKNRRDCIKQFGEIYGEEKFFTNGYLSCILIELKRVL